jgi:hypothetical protein
MYTLFFLTWSKISHWSVWPPATVTTPTRLGPATTAILFYQCRVHNYDSMRWCVPRTPGHTTVPWRRAQKQARRYLRFSGTRHAAGVLKVRPENETPAVFLATELGQEQGSKTERNFDSAWSHINYPPIRQAFAFHASRSTLHASRFTLHASRFTLHTPRTHARLTPPASRLPPHASRLIPGAKDQKCLAAAGSTGSVLASRRVSPFETHLAPLALAIRVGAVTDRSPASLIESRCSQGICDGHGSGAGRRQ